MPGHPTIGRITENGTHYIEGKLLEDSVFGADPFEPVKKSYIPDIIADQSKMPVRCLRREEPIEICGADNCRLAVCDVTCTEDIDRRLEELKAQGRLKLLAGCAALADRLVEIIPFHYTKRKMFQRQTVCMWHAEA